MGKGAEGIAQPRHAKVLAHSDATVGLSAKRMPMDRPPFTYADLKKAIPARCFQPSLLKSCYYLALDLIAFAALLYVSQFLDHPPAAVVQTGSPEVLAWVWPVVSITLWVAYTIVQGCVMTNLWVIAHECGHGGFSDYQWINDTVGFIIHAWMFVPYWSWKYSHTKHHKYNANTNHDEVFVPRPKPVPGVGLLHNSYIRVVVLASMLFFGWPMYLFFHLSGSAEEGIVCHFNPFSNLYKPNERFWVVLSNAGILATWVVCYMAAQQVGAFTVFKVYVLPLMVVFHNLALITWLHHTHPALPHYDDSEWEWMRGQLSTVDRAWGIFKYMFHDISTTHVVHHLFPSMPHYHAMEATKAIRPILGPYYMYDHRSVFGAAFKAMVDCQYAQPDSSGPKGVHWFKALHSE